MSTSNDIQGQYRGTRGELFHLAIVTTMLTIITLGIYRFWAKTRIRKYIWSSVSGDGDAFEYTGTGLEKFLGFLVAIVVLAIYLGIIQMVLFFFGLSFVAEPTTPAEMVMMVSVLYINLLAILPLVFYAVYRARRYKMARTRWRGVRFGMEQGAWGYALRASGYTILMIVSLGLMAPLANFKLEKYMMDRSWYGDAQFEQHGKWTALYGAMKHIFIGAIILVVIAGIGGALQIEGVMIAGVFVGYIWLMVGGLYYRVHAMRYFAANRTLGEHISFTAEPRTGEVLKLVVIGGLIIGAITFAILMVGGLAITGVVSSLADSQNFGAMAFISVIVAVLYLVLLALIGALTLVFITQPLISHFVTTYTVHGKDALAEISQRAGEVGVDAEGFADALDVGGAF